MRFIYKEEFERPSITIQDMDETDLSNYLTSDGLLDPKYFVDFLMRFSSSLESHIQEGYKALIRYAKEGNIDLFIQNNNISQINKVMIDTAFDSSYDFLKDTLRFYKYLTKCTPQQLDSILDNKLIEFFYAIYQNQNQEQEEDDQSSSNLICKSYIFKIFTNILSKNQSQFYAFINEGYHSRMYDIFWKHFDLIEESDNDSRIVASILKFLPVFYLNNDVILQRDPNFFKDWMIAFSECFQINNRIVIPALIESLQKCTNICNIKIVYLFFVERYFPIYFQFCNHSEKRVRLNMILTFLNFKQLESDDLLRIVNAGLFNIEFLNDETDIEEVIQFLNVIHQYLLKSKEIAYKISLSRFLFEINNHGILLTFPIKELYFVILAQLIRACQNSILNQVFNLCPLYIELSSELLDAVSDNHKIIILYSYFDLISYMQTGAELSPMIREKFFSNDMFELLNNFESSSDDVNSLVMALKSKFVPS